MGGNVKEFLRLVEEFVNMIGLQMSGFQDIYEVTENLGEPPHLLRRLLPHSRVHYPLSGAESASVSIVPAKRYPQKKLPIIALESASAAPNHTRNHVVQVYLPPTGFEIKLDKSIGSTVGVTVSCFALSMTL